ncbi:MAG: hypothetical protein LBS29_05745, partial [Endomicrobium sp.]|nr:hypothetical protein [Endomicrobium sp.]
NNTLSFTSSDIDLSTTSVYLVNTSSYSQNSIIHNIVTENNYVNFVNAKFNTHTKTNECIRDCMI